MKSLASEGGTVFLSSHLMGEMAETADHLLVIAQGRIIADAGTEEFINRNAASSVHVRAVEQTDLADALILRGGVVERSPDGGLQVTGLDCVAIGGVACAHDITLFELVASRASLEQAFFELTRDATDYRAGELAGATQGA